MKKLCFVVAVCLSIIGCNSEQLSNVVTSPDGRIVVEVDTTGDGVPCYSLMFGDEALIEDSPLGIVTSDGDFSMGLQLAGVKHSAANSTWSPVWGERAEVVDRYNALEATFCDAEQRELKVEFRLYNDGVGFRYHLQGDEGCYVLDESTTFALEEDCEAHWIAGSYDDDEYAYMHTLMSEITLENMALSSSGNRKLPYPSVNTPVTLVTKRGTHLAIHEAALWNYPAMSLRYDAEHNAFISDLASLQEVKAPVELPFVTPWRVVIVGDRAGALAESTIVLNLNEPCRLEDTSWIKPMKYVGVWWEMHLKLSTWDCDGAAPHCATTENVKRYIDFAAENGFGGVLVEGWNIGWGRDERFDYTLPYGDFDIEEIVRYGRERGVVLIGHHETYANVENYEEQMEDAYKYYAEQGVPSVKTGYVGTIRDRLHNSYEMVHTLVFKDFAKYSKKEFSVGIGVGKHRIRGGKIYARHHEYRRSTVFSLARALGAQDIVAVLADALTGGINLRGGRGIQKGACAIGKFKRTTAIQKHITVAVRYNGVVNITADTFGVETADEGVTISGNTLGVVGDNVREGLACNL